jgi:hypothetical protein
MTPDEIRVGEIPMDRLVAPKNPGPILSGGTCNHDWETCPVHATGSEELPGFATVIECAYGGLETKAGTPFGAEDANAVVERVIAQLRAAVGVNSETGGDE